MIGEVIQTTYMLIVTLLLLYALRKKKYSVSWIGGLVGAIIIEIGMITNSSALLACGAIIAFIAISTEAFSGISH